MRPSLRRVGTRSLAVATVTAALLVGGPVAAQAAVTATVQVQTQLSVRTGPSSQAERVGLLSNGTQVSIRCSVPGQYIRGSVRATTQWDQLVSGNYVSHAYIRTTTSIPRCPKPSAPSNTPLPEPTGSMTPSEFIAASVPGARLSQKEARVPASVTIAQAILESGWGKSALSARDRNFFGMKCNNRGTIAVGCRTYTTSECRPDGTCYRTSASFRVYRSAADSFRDHGYLLANAPRYRPAFAYTSNPDRFVVAIHRAGYATSPTYATQLQNIMKRYNLYQYDL